MKPLGNRLIFLCLFKTQMGEGTVTNKAKNEIIL